MSGVEICLPPVVAWEVGVGGGISGSALLLSLKLFMDVLAFETYHCKKNNY